MDKALIHVSNLLIDRFKTEGLVIQRYDAYSSNSIYLKLDYGLANSVRISDHPGKKHLSYRYNIIKGLGSGYSSRDQKNYKGKKFLERFYYPITKNEDLVQDVLGERQRRINRYGWQNYVAYMERNKSRIGKDKGFWCESKIV